MRQEITEGESIKQAQPKALMFLFPKPGSLDFYLNACIKGLQNNSTINLQKKKGYGGVVHCEKQGSFLEGLQRRPDNTDTLNQGGSHREKVDERDETRFG